MAVNDLIYTYGTQKTITTTGAAISNNALGSASGGYNQSDTNYYTDAVFVLLANFSSSPSLNSTLELYIQETNVVGSNSNPAPDTPGSIISYKGRRLCAFSPKNVTGAQYLVAVSEGIPKEGNLFLFNNNTGVSLPVNWGLWMTPRAYKAATS